MKIKEAINLIDMQKHNTYSQGEKIGWLSKVDGMVKRLIIDTHEGGEDVVFTGYDDKTDPETELLVPAPFDGLYIRYLETVIDYTNGEYDKYNNTMMMFKSEYDTYASYYNRSHMPKGSKIKFF